jgi:hypothetical protein
MPWWIWNRLGERLGALGQRSIHALVAGGAGTVAAGLRAGKPTMVCPFFGDQFFWVSPISLQLMIL